MRICVPLTLLAAGLVVAAGRPALAAKGQVKLEIVGDAQQGAGMAFQQWIQPLSAAGIKDVRLRTANDSDKAGIEVGGTDQNPIYTVTAVLRGEELLVPGARFRRSDLKRMAAWLDEVARRGPPDRREPLAAFGLTEKQLKKLQADLARPVGFATKGETRAAAVAKIARQVSIPLKIDGQLTDGEEKIEEELSSLSCGTALASILRPIGYSMMPREAGDSYVYSIIAAKPGQEIWPIGWECKKLHELVPALFEMRNVNVAGVTATKVTEVVAAQLKLPVLWDYSAMARFGIEPEKAVVAHPSQRTTYSMALRRMLFKVGLQYEVRLDEAEKPFLWISTVKAIEEK